MAGLRAGLLLGCGVAVWLVSTGPLAPFRRAFLDRSPPQLVMVLGGMWIVSGLAHDSLANSICRC